MVEIHITDIIPLIGIPGPTHGRTAYNITCPCCDDSPGKKHLNINLVKDVFCCPRCKFSGGVFDLYAYYANVDRTTVREVLIERLGLKDSGSSYEGSRKRERRTPVQPFQQDIELPLTDIDARHETYTALLSKLSLASDHRENLMKRGLTDEKIRELGYKTMPVIGFTAIAKQLQSEGFYLAGVPGFYHTKEGNWTLVQEKRGILVPTRTPDGKIQGLQVRRDNIKKGKFRWVSSVGKQDGCKAETWTHIAGGPAQTVLLTEGPMKCDIINYLTGLTVIAVPGVNSLTHLRDTLEYVKQQGTTRIMTAFDMDYLKNPHVKDGYINLANLIADVGIDYGTYLWDPQFKGLDDYIKVTAKSLADGLLGTEVKLLIENDSTKNILITSGSVSANGYMMPTAALYAEVAAGKKANESLTLMSSEMDQCGIGTLAEMQFYLQIQDPETWETIKTTDLITLATSATGYTQPVDDSGDVLYNENGYKVVCKGLKQDIIWDGTVVFYMENNSNKAVSIYAENVSVNGFMQEVGLWSDLRPSTKMIDGMSMIDLSDLEITNIDEIKTIEFNLRIVDAETWEEIVTTDAMTLNFE